MKGTIRIFFGLALLLMAFDLGYWFVGLAGFCLLGSGAVAAVNYCAGLVNSSRVSRNSEKP